LEKVQKGFSSVVKQNNLEKIWKKIEIKNIRFNFLKNWIFLEKVQKCFSSVVKQNNLEKIWRKK